jgi:hypothetical protein
MHQGSDTIVGYCAKKIKKGGGGSALAKKLSILHLIFTRPVPPVIPHQTES